MVREARFSFDDGMNVNYPVPEDDEEDDFDSLVTDRQSPLKAPRRAPRERKWNQPDDRRPDRRQQADADWLKRTQPDERPDESADGEQK